jgi:serine/threonine protein phosphatase 1
MSGRTFVIGDIHGELSHLKTLWARFPPLEQTDTVVFLGDYVDRGPDSRGVLEFLLTLQDQTPAKLVFLRGNHEDGWLKVLEHGFPEFLLPAQNGTWAFLRSYRGRPLEGETPNDEDMQLLLSGSFMPSEVVAWMNELLWYYEDEHGIYVHAGLPQKDGKFLHPSEVEDAIVLLWLRSREFFESYHGKRVVCGHTATEDLPDLSTYTPHDPTDLWFRGDVVALDTKCGKEGGFLTALELPALHVYESR